MQTRSQSRASPQISDPLTKPPPLNNLPVVAEAEDGSPLANPIEGGSIIISHLKKAITIRADMGVEQVSEYLYYYHCLTFRSEAG